MSERVARRPSLFTVPAAEGSETKLLGTRCRAGHLCFPPQWMGCEVCGAWGDDLSSVEIEPAGTLRSFARAHRDKRPGSDAPLVVGTVLLDAGPSIEVVLEVDDESGLACGQRVEGRLVAIDADQSGRPVVDCFFHPAPSQDDRS